MNNDLMKNVNIYRYYIFVNIFNHVMTINKIQYIITLLHMILKKYMQGFLVKRNDYLFTAYTMDTNAYNCLYFFKYSSILSFPILLDIICVDYISKFKKFELSYLLVNIFTNIRILVKCTVAQFISVNSCSNLYLSAN